MSKDNNSMQNVELHRQDMLMNWEGRHFTNMLDEMFRLQKSFAQKFIHFDNLSIPEQEGWTQQLLLCMMDEMSEVLNWTNFKHWKATQTPVNLVELKYELIDMLHFLLNLMLVWGMDEKECFSMYVAKNRENFARQKGGYGHGSKSESGSEERDKRSEDSENFESKTDLHSGPCKGDGLRRGFGQDVCVARVLEGQRDKTEGDSNGKGRDKVLPVRLSTSEDLTEDHDRFQKILMEAEELRWRKLQDYGASYRGFGPLGVAVRMSDKMARITNLLQKSGKPNNESLRDSFIDLVNYGAMACMLLDQKEGK